MNNIWSSQFGSTRQEIVHHTLAFGSLQECKLLIDKYGFEAVKSDFLTPKKGLYSRQALGYAQLMLDVQVNAQNYVKSIY